MEYQITTAPAHEPVSLERAKRHLRIDDDDSDDLLRSCLTAARRWCEGFTGRSFLWQTIAAKRDDLPVQIELPCPPLRSVSSITYIDAAGATQTASSTLYDVDSSSEPGRIVLGYDQTWPTVRGHHHDVTITFIAGHAVSFTRSGSTLIVSGHLFNVNDFVQVYNVGGGLPTGLAAATSYYVKSVAGSTIELALTEAGAAVAMSGDGTGTHYIDALPAHYASAVLLRLTDLWTHRGDEQVEPSRQLRELLSMGRMVPV